MKIERYKEGFKPTSDEEQRNAKSKKYIMWMLTALIIYGLGFIYFIFNLQYKTSFPNEPTDAIITLTGETKRIVDSITELSKGNAKRLFISGVYREAPINKVIDKTINWLQKEKKLLSNPEAFKAKIETGKAENTIENALESAMWIKKNNIKSIRLITSYYHMPRSKLVFQKYIPESVVIVYHPILFSDENPSPFTDYKLLKLVFSEYNKYIITYLWNLAGMETKLTLQLQGALNEKN